MGIAEKTSQLPPQIPRNTAVTEALELGVTPAEILYARAADVCLFDYVAYRRDHDHAETLATYHEELDPERLTMIGDCNRCASAELETLEERLCHRDEAELEQRLNEPPADQQY